MSGQEKYDIAVLYVEDDASTREEVEQFLRRRVREVFTAQDGNEGLASYQKHSPDIIVTDIRMPDMDGLTMAREIRKLYKGALIIVTTAHSDTRYMLDSIDIGIDQYVLKPISIDKLTEAILKCAEIVEYRRAHKRFLAEREQMITDLQKALDEIKTLHGILPICSFCKKIRDDKKTWTQLETYISQHTDAQFSHGLCDDCAKKHYPDYFKK